ncbi:MAG TPA: hypothetical protein VEH81_07850 [Ktedonobacteraceae bacterium]|nr:hypothetical protein [Ktedonobacteraceae bacterium]
MELSLRLDTLGMVEVHYLRGRDRYRDWPPFRFVAASRQARVFAYMNREVVDQLHQQILAVEEAAGLGSDGEDDDDVEDRELEETGESKVILQGERETAPLSPAFAQALERLNDLARQRLPEPGSNVESTIEDLAGSELSLGDEEDALEQLQDAFVQMMEVVRELAEELSTDALKLTGRFRCARIEVFFTQTEPDEHNEADHDDEEVIGTEEELRIDGGLLQVELALVLRLYEEGHSRSDDLPAVELQLDVDDFERLHETLDIAMDRERRSSRRRR